MIERNATAEGQPDFAPPQLTHRQVLVIFSGLMLGMLLAALDQTVLATALPTIVGELGGIDHLSWVISAYLLASTTSVPIYGKLGDLYGRKRLFQFGIALFLVGSVLAGASQSMTQIILCRFVQGLGAGGLMVTSQAIIGDILSPRDRGRYIGYLAIVFAFSSVAGPLIGGLFTDHIGWRWVFYVNLPIGLFALFVTSRVLHLPKRRVEHDIDYLGALLLTGAISSILLATTWGGHQYAWDSPTIVGLFAARHHPPGLAAVSGDARVGADLAIAAVSQPDLQRIERPGNLPRHGHVRCPGLRPALSPGGERRFGNRVRSEDYAHDGGNDNDGRLLRPDDQQPRPLSPVSDHGHGDHLNRPRPSINNGSGYKPGACRRVYARVWSGHGIRYAGHHNRGPELCRPPRHGYGNGRGQLLPVDGRGARRRDVRLRSQQPPRS